MLVSASKLRGKRIYAYVDTINDEEIIELQQKFKKVSCKPSQSNCSVYSNITTPYFDKIEVSERIFNRPPLRSNP
jgi:hypothetical protein